MSGTPTAPALSVALGYWQDRPPVEALITAQAADALGYRELWVGEMATYDAFALATTIGSITERLRLVIGPLAVAVRDPMLIARGVASVADLTGRPVDVALGTSSPVVVGGWHGRGRARSVTVLRESVQAVRELLSGRKVDFEGRAVSTRGYRLRLDPPGTGIAVAAFGPAAIRTAARLADRMVLNLVTPRSAAVLVGHMRAEAVAAGREPPRVTAWVPVAAGGDPAAMQQIRRGMVGYLAAPGYDEMFVDAGFGDLVDHARTRPAPRELLAEVPSELVRAVALVGDRAAIRRRLVEYAEAGIDEIALVPASVDPDPGGRGTLAALRGLTERAAAAQA